MSRRFITGSNIKVEVDTDDIDIIGGSDVTIDNTYNNTTNIRNGAIEVTDTSITQTVKVVTTNYSIETGPSVSVTPGKFYSYNGVVASTWTLSTIALNTGIETRIYNRGSEVITVNSNLAANDIYYNGAAVSTFAILPGENVLLFGDTAYIIASGIKKPRVFVSASAPTFFETDDIWIDI